MSDDAQTQARAIASKRVVYALPGVDSVVVERDVMYRATAAGPLTMDVYTPPDRRRDERLPAVVFVAGYPDRGFQAMLGCRFKEMGSTVSWARLAAVSGLVAIAYANHEPASDLDAVLAHLRGSAADLGIDHERIGLWASSGNVPLALSALMEQGASLRCAALCYGLTLDLEGATAVADASRTYGFVNPAAGRSIDDLPAGTPLFLARAGRDQTPGLNDALDRFVAHALRRNLPITVSNHPSGPHAFDLFDDSEASREIVRQVLAFLRSHLLGR